MKAWVDGSGRGPYGYIAEDGQCNIGMLPKVKHYRSIKAEFHAVLMALRELRTRPLHLLTDNTTVHHYCNTWGRTKGYVREEMEAIRPYLLDNDVKVLLIDGRDNRADKLIRKHPARMNLVSLRGVSWI